MSSSKARQLLLAAAYLYKHEREHFSKDEIIQKINEIKYLSAQKKVPRLSLRKEIIHLENKLQAVFEIEQQALQRKKGESIQVVSLKKQITTLQKKLQTAEDKNLQKKVEKLSHLLGEYLAKEGSKEEIQQVEQILGKKNAKKQKIVHPKQLLPQIAEQQITADVLRRVEELHCRIALLKQEAAMAAHLQKTTPAHIKSIQDKITFLESKLQEFQAGKNVSKAAPESSMPITAPEISPHLETTEIKHRLLFGPIESEDTLQRELPLPPPPRMTKR